MMNFQNALEAALSAKKAIARTGWNGQGMFVYMVGAASYPAQSGVAKEQFGEDALVPYGAYLAIYAADHKVYPWTPSQADTFANDWVIVS